MLTPDKVDHFAQTLADAFTKLPGLVAQVRETAEALEACREQVEERDGIIESMNLIVTDLRDRLKGLENRCHELIAQNARLENVIMTAGTALASSPSFVSAAQQLAGAGSGTHNGRAPELPSVDVTG